MSDEIKVDAIWDELYVLGNQNIFGMEIPDGAIVQRLEIAVSNNAYYQFPAFFIWKLYMAMAKNSEIRAAELSHLFQRTQLRARAADKRKIYALHTPNPGDDLQYFQAIISAYIFSFNTLEAYVNLRLDAFDPEISDYLANQEITKKTCSCLIRPKTDLIKESSLEEKLFSILPYYLEKKKIDLKKISSYKSDFNNIQFIRDELIHPKRLKNRTSQINGSYQTKKLWNRLIPCFNNKGILLSFYPAQFVSKLIDYIDEACSKK